MIGPCPGCGETRNLRTYHAEHVSTPGILQIVQWCDDCAIVAFAPEGSMGAVGCGEWTRGPDAANRSAEFWRAELARLMEYVGGWDMPPHHPCGRAAHLLGRSEYRGPAL